MPAVSWGKRPSVKAAAAQSGVAKTALDKFVNPQTKATKRLNADIPADLHARMKAKCAMDGVDMTEMLIELLEKQFPAK